MRITAFEGGKGDCILLQSNQGKNILIDGGHVDPHFHRVFSYKFNVAPTLGQLREAGEILDLVCVSHIDQDHIGGIVSMLDDEFAWRVFDHQSGQGLEVDEPESPRPPEITGIWHNSFHELISKNRRAIKDVLAAAAPASLALGGGPQSHGSDFFARLGTSMKEAAQVSRRIGASQLAIPLNAEFDGKLVMRRTNDEAFEIGDLVVSILGPTPKRLRDLRKEWNDWLRSAKGKRQIKEVKRNAAEDEDALAAGDISGFLENTDLGPAVGDRNTVSEENVASIVLMVEEDGKSVLLTGDARDDHIVDDLIATGFADEEGHAHVNVLKLQHHASENNFSIDFGKFVTADHYLFCGNGKHKNPDLEVVERLLNSRISTGDAKSPNVQADDHFNLWFTSDGSTFKADAEHMAKVVKMVEEIHSHHAGRFDFHFSNDAFLSFDI